MEAETGVQCYMHYIFDLEALNFDPTLLGVVNGDSSSIICNLLFSKFRSLPCFMATGRATLSGIY